MSERRGGILPGGEGIRQALKWLSDRRTVDPSAPRMKLIQEAALRFDLTPLETEFLATSWKEG